MIQKKINLEKACEMSLNHTLFKNPGILKIKKFGLYIFIIKIIQMKLIMEIFLFR